MVELEPDLAPQRSGISVVVITSPLEFSLQSQFSLAFDRPPDDFMIINFIMDAGG